MKYTHRQLWNTCTVQRQPNCDSYKETTKCFGKIQWVYLFPDMFLEPFHRHLQLVWIFPSYEKLHFLQLWNNSVHQQHWLLMLSLLNFFTFPVWTHTFGTQLHVSMATLNINISAASLSHVAEELCGLLEQSHQAALGEVAPRTHPVLVRGQDVIRHRRLLQHVGWDVLRRKSVG